MKYYPDKAKITYKSKYGKDVKEFSSLKWMAALVPHDRTGESRLSVITDSTATQQEANWKKEAGEPEASSYKFKTITTKITL